MDASRICNCFCLRYMRNLRKDKGMFVGGLEMNSQESSWFGVVPTGRRGKTTLQKLNKKRRSYYQIILGEVAKQERHTSLAKLYVFP
jgi:hypothetical protein